MSSLISTIFFEYRLCLIGMAAAEVRYCETRGRIQSEEMITIKWSRSNGHDQLIRDFLLEIFRIHEQFAAGELN